MFDFGDELIIESYRIPWLIWIQLLVMLLLIILLYIFALDLSHNSSDTASSSSSVIDHHPQLTKTLSEGSHHSHTKHQLMNFLGMDIFWRYPFGIKHNGVELKNGMPCKVREEASKKGEHIGTSTRNRIRVAENSQEREFSSKKEVPTNVTLVQRQRPHHPCHFLGLATQAFLKCFGFDSTSHNVSNDRQEKDR